MRKRSLYDGAFIVIEGPEGSGKTTQAALLEEALRNAGLSTILFRSPGGTPEGEEIRNLLLHSQNPLTPKTEVLLFLADRAAIVERVIKPAISERQVVIADRFDVSTFAYQVAGRQLPFGPVVAANEFAKDGLVPDLIFYLEIDFEVAKERLQKRGKKLDKIESSGGDFHRRVHDGYEKYIRLYPQSVRFHLPKSVTERPPAAVHQYIMEELKRRFVF